MYICITGLCAYIVHVRVDVQWRHVRARYIDVLCLPARVQGALTQLIQYYHRFHKLLSQAAPFKSMPIRNELINIHNVMVEVKKHKPTF